MRNGPVDGHLLGVVGHHCDAILTVERRDSRLGRTSHLMAYTEETHPNARRLELAELLPPLEENSKVAATMPEKDLIVLAATVGQFRFAVYKIQLPRSLSAETVPRLIAQPERRDAAALHALGLGKSGENEQSVDLPEGLGSDLGEEMSSSESESLCDSLLSEDEHYVGNQDGRHSK